MDDNTPATDPILNFESIMVGTAIMSGNGTDGKVRFTFFTPEGQPNLSTVLSPSLTVDLASSLMLAVSEIPKLDDALGVTIPRKRPAKNLGEVHFGQSYPSDILQSLGLLVVRVNLLERSMVHLLAEIARVSQEQAEALFYSTMNMKARVDMITLLAQASGLGDYCSGLVTKALDRVASVNSQRNNLIHGHWTLNNDNFAVNTINPRNPTMFTSQTVTKKSLEILAVDYRSAGIACEGAASSIKTTRSMARNTDATNTSSPSGTL